MKRIQNSKQLAHALWLAALLAVAIVAVLIMGCTSKAAERPVVQELATKLGPCDIYTVSKSVGYVLIASPNCNVSVSTK